MEMWDLYATTRAPLKLPKLHLKNQVEALEKLLEPVREIPVPSDSESECSSGTIDAFEEFHRDNFLRPLPGSKTKFPSKLEADWKTVQGFTEDFKRTMKALREDLSESMTLEDERTIEEELTNRSRAPFFINKKKVASEEQIRVEPDDLRSETTSNSAVWNMIKANKREYFSVSPPLYDIYNLRPDHYLKRPHVPWTELEESRKKCEKWLKQCELTCGEDALLLSSSVRTFRI